MMLKNLIDVRASYSIAHIVKVLFLLSENPMGRNQLIKEIGLGEATIKTLIKRLKKNDLVKKTTKGSILTKKGTLLVGKILKNISRPVEIGILTKEYTVGKYNFALLIKNASNKIKSGIEQRDEAIKIGADGATTLVCKNDKLVFPGCNKKIVVLERVLRKIFKIENEDVIIIGSDSTKKKAEEASLVAALSLWQKKAINKEYQTD